MGQRQAAPAKRHAIMQSERHAIKRPERQATVQPERHATSQRERQATVQPERHAIKQAERHAIKQRVAASASTALASMALIGLGILAGTTAAEAGDGCKPVTGMAASIDKFIDEVYQLQQSGQGTLPVADALFGFEHIEPADLRALDAREPIQVMPQHDKNGVFLNRGPNSVVINGKFAKADAFFDIPPLVTGSYVSTQDSLVLTYDPAHAVKVGQTFLGMTFSRTINHTVITRRKLSYFFDSNTDGKPDRCYQLVDN
jgi:hypothetical protein